MAKSSKTQVHKAKRARRQDKSRENKVKNKMREEMIREKKEHQRQDSGKHRHRYNKNHLCHFCRKEKG